MEDWHLSILLQSFVDISLQMLKWPSSSILRHSVELVFLYVAFNHVRKLDYCASNLKNNVVRFLKIVPLLLFDLATLESVRCGLIELL